MEIILSMYTEWHDESVAFCLQQLAVMKYSQIAALITLLLASYGEVQECCLTDWQEDCAGAGKLTEGVLYFGLKGDRRDVFWQQGRIQLGVFQ